MRNLSVIFKEKYFFPDKNRLKEFMTINPDVQRILYWKEFISLKRKINTPKWIQEENRGLEEIHPNQHRLSPLLKGT